MLSSFNFRNLFHCQRAVSFEARITDTNNGIAFSKIDIFQSSDQLHKSRRYCFRANHFSNKHLQIIFEIQMCLPCENIYHVSISGMASRPLSWVYSSNTSQRDFVMPFYLRKIGIEKSTAKIIQGIRTYSFRFVLGSGIFRIVGPTLFQSRTFGNSITWKKLIECWLRIKKTLSYSDLFCSEIRIKDFVYSSNKKISK